jgi:hypothetical protein
MYATKILMMKGICLHFCKCICRERNFEPITKCHVLLSGSHFCYLDTNGNFPVSLKKNYKESPKANHILTLVSIFKVTQAIQLNIVMCCLQLKYLANQIMPLVPWRTRLKVPPIKL